MRIMMKKKGTGSITLPSVSRTFENPGIVLGGDTEYFGSDVTGDSTHLLVAATGVYVGNGYLGQAYLINKSNDTVEVTYNAPNTEQLSTTGFNVGQGGSFGSTKHSIALFGIYVAIGDQSSNITNDGSYVGSGSVNVYDRTTGNLLYVVSNDSASSEWAKNICINNGRLYVSDSSSYPGSVYVFNITDGVFIEKILYPGSSSTSPYFSIDMVSHGNLLYVTASGAHLNSGEVHVYDITNVSATFVETIPNPTPILSGTSDFFGASIEISDDYIAIHARQEDSNDLTNYRAGQVHIYDTATRTYLRSISNTNAAVNYWPANYGIIGNELWTSYQTDRSVYSLITGSYIGASSVVGFTGTYEDVSAIHYDGSTVYVSDRYSDESTNYPNRGIVHKFDPITRSSNANIPYPGTTGGNKSDDYGRSIACDGNTLVVGLPQEEYPEPTGGVSSGAAAVYDYTTGTLLHEIINPNYSDTPKSDIFGTSVEVYQDYIFVSAPHEDTNGSAAAGIVYVFDRTTGLKIKNIIAPDRGPNDYFGLYMIAKNNRLYVSGPGNNPEKVYVFDIANNFNYLFSITNPNDETSSTNDNFGTSMDVSDTYIAIGADYEHYTNNTYSTTGIIYIFDLTGTEVRRIVNPNIIDGNPAGERLGYYVKIQGNKLFAIAYSAKRIFQFDITDGSFVRTYGLGSQYMLGLAASENRIVFSDEPGKFKVCDTNTGELLYDVVTPVDSTNNFFNTGIMLSDTEVIIADPYSWDDVSVNSGKLYVYNLPSG